MELPFREPHWLPNNHGQKMPSSVAFLALDFDEVISGQDERTLKYQIKKGVIIHVRYERGKPKGKRIIVDCQSGSCFADLYRLVKPARSLHVCVCNPKRDYGMAGLSCEFSEGRLSLTRGPRIPGKSDQDRLPMASTTRGFTWLERDRGISVCYHGLSKLVLLGIGNFLGYKEDLSMPCKCRAVGMADLFARYLAFLGEHHAGGFAFTIAGQSLRSFRHYHKGYGIHIHGNRQAYDLENKSIRGGREQLFYYGKASERLFQLDVNSLYAAAMRGKQFPAEIRGHFQCPGRNRDGVSLDYGFSIARVYLRSTQNEYPVSRYGKLVYAKGNFVACLAGPELEQACRNKEIANIGELVVYRTEELFTRYVDFWWDARQRARAKGDNFSADLCKQFLARLWGKWGQKNTNWIDNDAIQPDKEIEYWYQSRAGESDYTELRKIGKQVEMQVKGLAAFDSFPAIAAFVTSYARLHMDSLRHIAGERNVYMQYIDSLIVNQAGLNNLQESGKIDIDAIGALRLQSVSDRSTFYGATDYVWQNRPKICGVPKQAIEVSPGRYKFWVSNDSGPDDELGVCCNSALREVEIVLKRHRPFNFIRVDDWLGPVVVNE